MVLGGGDLGAPEVAVLAVAFVFLLLASGVAALLTIHAFSDAGPRPDERRRWTMLLAFGGPPALVAYWRRFVRPHG